MPRMQTPAGKAVAKGKAGVRGNTGAEGMYAGKRGVRADKSVVSNKLPR